jgi:O-antigen/teichoic acid export membrane protein|tara:strand:- start:484 stop:1839 length:1356 start_codon:yes stop_codon:yes gene_type:complete
MKTKIKNALKDKDFSEIIKGSGISFFLRFGGLAVGYLLTLLIANLFGANGLGDYVLAITILRLFTLLAKLGLDTTSIRFIAAFASQDKWTSIFRFRKQVISILSISSIVASLLMYFLAEPIADLINANYKYIQLSAFFVLPMAFFMLHYESLRGLKRIAAFSFFYMMAQGLFTIVSVLIIHQFTISSNVPIYAYLVSVFIVSILSFLSFKYSLKKSAKGKESAEKELRSYSEILKISVPLMFAQSVQFIMAWTDKLMLGAIDTPNVSLGLTTNSSEVGIYHTAFKLSMFAAVALMSINSIASPKFAEMYASKNKEGLKKIVHQSTKMIFWVTLPLVVIFFSIPDFLLGLFGEEFKIGMFAFILLSCGKMISAFSGSVGNILQMTGNQNILARILFLGAIINVLLNLILIPKYGINGAAIASTISTVFWNITMVFAVKKKLGFYSFYLPFIR